jgi:6-pyruvoyltetrahydropterin/6-carboxytetrahydropterin synthase
MYYLSIETTISAAHRLEGYTGNCSILHGHNWKIKVKVKTDVLDNVGMGLDFKDLKELTWKVVGKFDHQTINNIPPFDKMNPTAEHLAKYMYEEINQLLPKHIQVDRISLWETEKYMAEYCEK